jgi:hypothetical protein
MLALELAAGAAPDPLGARGTHRDLAEVFERVNRGCFGGRLGPPRLVWSRRHTGRKLGHYQPLTDTVMLSLNLDDARVPDVAVDFVMYHELLHRELGAQIVNGRHIVHGPAFRRAERRFPGYEAAQAFLGGAG